MEGLYTRELMYMYDWNAEDNQYWNYHDDYKGINFKEIPRYKNAPAQMPALFIWKELGQWLPPGVIKYACAGITVIDDDPCGSSVQLGQPLIEVLPTNFSNHKSEDAYT